MSVRLETVDDALEFLVALGASRRLVQHGRLVAEAAKKLVEGLHPARIRFDARIVLLGAALHDAGKITHPEELEQPGRFHEMAGQTLLEGNGIEPELARFCATHADWRNPACTLEDLLVALADKLWKGKREDELESLIIQRFQEVRPHEDKWTVFLELDSLFESVADDGARRLMRSI